MSNEELIINYDDKNKYNKCNLITKDTNYILYIYFGIASTSLLNEVNYNTTYNLYFGKSINKKKKLLDTSITFNLIDKVNHFFNASLEGNNNYIYNVDDGINNYLYICFGSGRPMFYDTTQELDDYIYTDKIDYTNQTNSRYKPRYNELITLLSKLKSFIESNKYKKFILCGHSNGIVVATFISYVLLILSADDNLLNQLPKHHNVNKFIKNINHSIVENNTIYNENTTELSGKISKDIINFKSLKNSIQNNIYICGTAGYPILWTKVEEFNIFNSFYKNKYIHIISGFNKYNIQIYDTMTYYNKFQYIYEKVHALLSDTTLNDNDKKPKIQKLYTTKNINYTYFNFGSIVFNLINHTQINCFLIDTLFNKLKHSDDHETRTNINYVDIHLDKHHSFSFYRQLYKTYMHISK
jgi:hypothetical protein